jgi:hypothetical protein
MEANQSDRINYSAEDLQRYHRGEMSASEMHQLEKAALSDPFLSDAMDGFYQTNPYDRSALVSAIKKHQKPNSTLQRIYAYTGIAASIMVILFTTQILTKEDHPVDNSLAKRNNNPEKINPIRKDSEQIKLAKIGKEDLIKAKETVPIQDYPQKKENIKTASVKIPEKTATEANMIEKNEEARFEEPIKVEEKSVPVQQDNIQLAAQSDGKDEQLVMLRATSTQKNKSLALAVNNGIMPLTGWDAFHRYMTNGLKAVPLTETDMEQKNYLVRFVLDRENKPTSIEFPTSPYPSEGLKHAIIALLLKGPLWSGQFDEKKYIEVKITLP